MAARKKKNPSVLFDRRSLPASQPSPLAGTRFIWLLFFRIFSDAWRRVAHLSVPATDVKAKHAVGFTFAACPALQRSIPARRQCSEVDLPI